MNVKDKITFFYAIEEKLWDEKVNANKYLATLSILCVALLGAWHTAGSFLASSLNWHVEMSVFHAVMLVAYLWVLNAVESVLACDDMKTAVLRSLLMLVSIALAYIAGVVLGTIAIIIVCIVLFVLFCVFMLQMLGGNKKSPGLLDSLFGQWGEGEAKEDGLFGRKMKGEYYVGGDGRQKFREHGSNTEYDVE